MSGALSGFRVLELGASEAAGMAAMLLSDFGMEVIRVELPAGDTPLSNQDAITFGVTPTGDRLCDRGKRRVTLDWRQPDQREALLSLLSTCDVLLDGRAPWETAEGLDAEALKRQFPRLCHIAVTGYGATGPCASRPWSEGTIQAESGFMSTTGLEGGQTLRSGGDMADSLGGMMACIAALTTLLGRERQNEAFGADVSLMDAIVFGLENQFSLYLKSGIVPRPRGNSYALSAPVGNFPCGDGKEIMISVATEAQWQAFAQALGHEEWLDRPDFANVSRRIQNYKALGEEVTAAFSTFTREELMERLQSRSCIYGCINDYPAVVDHVQTEARQMFIEITAPNGGILRAPGDPILRADLSRDARILHAAGADTEDMLRLFDILH